MSKYSYIARTKQGTKDTGILEAANQDDAVSILQKKELIVTSIIQIDKKDTYIQKKASRPTANKFRHTGVKSGDLVIFARQLSMLLGAGVGLMKSLTVTQKQIDSKRLHDAISNMAKEMEAGRTFKDTLSKHKNIFSDLWIYLVETGEASGNLPRVLDHLATYLEEQQAFKTKIISALMYPAVLFLISIGAVLFFVMKIVPTFTKILDSMNIPLPLPTQILVGVSSFLIHRFFFLVIGVGAAIFIIRKLMKNDAVKNFVERTELKLPLFSNFFRFMMIESFSTTMSILIESGVPIIYALDISERSQPNSTLKQIIAGVKISVREGKSFATPLEKANFFPPMVIQMISTGEEIGELSGMFKKISEYYRQYIEAFVARMTALFEPLMIVFMGAIIGAMVVSIFLPIFSLATGSAG
ncbi:type II secretion system F family protein [Candidatus Omnitrophota bacterium]